MNPTCPTCFRILPQCREAFTGPYCECPQPTTTATRGTYVVPDGVSELERDAMIQQGTNAMKERDQLRVENAALRAALEAMLREFDYTGTTLRAEELALEQARAALAKEGGP